jgi:two-component system sensor histidine kinase and response regulator WspE
MSTADGSQSDPEMLELFQAEMDAHIPVLDQGLLALEKGQAGDQEIEAMMRAAHSIKGAAKIVGIEPAVRVSHVMEDCFTAAKKKAIVLSSDSVDVLLQGVDALHRICSSGEGSMIDENFLQGLVGRLTLLRSGESPASLTKVIAPKPTAGLVAASVRLEEPGVTLPAVFDDAAVSALRKELLDTLSMRPNRIRLDFAHVGDLTAAALALLASFAREARGFDPAPVVEASDVPAAVQSILRAAGVARAFGIDR